MKVTIAAQAALLLLGEEGYYFDRVTSFLVYPYKMVLPPHGVRPSADDGDFDERVILGQAFQQGEIILSWPDVLSGGRVADDGENVVLHELAHHLDGLDGQMGGSPPGLARDRQDHFHAVFERTLPQLHRDLAGDVIPLLPAASRGEHDGAVCLRHRSASSSGRPHLQQRIPICLLASASFTSSILGVVCTDRAQPQLAAKRTRRGRRKRPSWSCPVPGRPAAAGHGRRILRPRAGAVRPGSLGPGCGRLRSLRTPGPVRSGGAVWRGRAELSRSRSRRPWPTPSGPAASIPMTAKRTPARDVPGRGRQL